jgi:hypothetical protein
MYPGRGGKRTNKSSQPKHIARYGGNDVAMTARCGVAT